MLNNTNNTERFDQITLFDVGIDLQEIRAEQEVLMGHSQAANTIKGYRHSWKIFTRWCQEAGKNPLPASSDTVALFVTWAALKRRPPYRIANIRHIVAAVRDKHRSEGKPNPIDWKVSDTIRSAARRVQEEPGGKEPLTPAQLLSATKIRERSPIRLRNRAVLLVGFASGWRRSELTALDLKHVRFEADHLRLRLGRSKADQEGKGRLVRIPYARRATLCPVRALKEWIEARGNWAGPLFPPFDRAGKTIQRRRMGSMMVNQIVKEALERVGVDPRAFGAHSLRAGMATAAAEAGADIVSIMQRGGWHSMDAVLRYIRPAEGMRADPLKGVL